MARLLSEVNTTKTSFVEVTEEMTNIKFTTGQNPLFFFEIRHIRIKFVNQVTIFIHLSDTEIGEFLPLAYSFSVKFQ